MRHVGDHVGAARAEGLSEQADPRDRALARRRPARSRHAHAAAALQRVARPAARARQPRRRRRCGRQQHGGEGGAGRLHVAVHHRLAHQHAAVQQEHAVRSGARFLARVAGRAELRPGAGRAGELAGQDRAGTDRARAAAARQNELRLRRHRHREPHPGRGDEVDGRRRHRRRSIQGRARGHHRHSSPAAWT